MQDPRVNCGELLWEEQGIPAYQIHLIVCWDVWKTVGPKTIGDDSCFFSSVSCDLDEGGEWHAALVGAWGALAVMGRCVGSSVSELGIWQF